MKEYQKSLMYLNIKDGAIFVADSHFNDKNQEFLYFLNKIKAGEIETPQLFLMGDMIDFISEESKYFVKKNKVIIDILNELSNNIEIIYLEGNHDYNLNSLFPNIIVVSRVDQPLIGKTQNDKIINLSHGDNFSDWKYNIYCIIIRNKYLLNFLNFLDIDFFISKKIENSLIKKNICYKINDFERIAKKRVVNYNSDIVIEGHFHQGGSYFIDNKIYINVPSLFCQKKYLKFENFEFKGQNI
jgi:UDP-2,3-diacylglucosamine hydrolase